MPQLAVLTQRYESTLCRPIGSLRAAALACFCFYRFGLHIFTSSVSGCHGRVVSNQARACDALISCPSFTDWLLRLKPKSAALTENVLSAVCSCHRARLCHRVKSDESWMKPIWVSKSVFQWRMDDLT
ncbi:hypothetical protein ABVT39_003787 [Epinephelus coioides]